MRVIKKKKKGWGFSSRVWDFRELARPALPRSLASSVKPIHRRHGVPDVSPARDVVHKPLAGGAAAFRTNPAQEELGVKDRIPERLPRSGRGRSAET